MRGILVVVGLMLLSGQAVAQSLEEIDQREAAVVEAWNKTPLIARRALFVTERANGFGQYEERGSDVFKPGEKMIAYIEPVGYGWKEAGPGLFEFGFIVDFLIKAKDGEVLAGHENFAKLVEKSHVRNREFMLNLTVNFTGAPPGEYVLEYKLRDVAGPKSTAIELPFEIAK